MPLVKVCPICYRSYPDVSLNFCTDDGSPLSPPLEIGRTADEPEIETVIRGRATHMHAQASLRSSPETRYKKNVDRFIEAAVQKHKILAFHVNSGNEHCVELIGRENKGSVWIRPRKNGYRLQTTGQAQRLDSYIENLCGLPVGSAKAQVYKYWYTDSASEVERIIDRFATLA